MTNGALAKMASGLQGEVDELQSTLDGLQKGNGDKLDGLKKRLADAKDQKKKQATSTDKAVGGREKMIQDIKKATEDDQSEIADITEQVTTNKAILKNVQLSINLRMEDIHACGCEKLKDSKLLVTGSRRTLEVEPDKVDYDLVFKIEKLERTKAKLSKEITKEQSTYGWKSRDLMERKDAEKIKMDMVDSSNSKFKALDETRLNSVKAQQANIKRVLERKTAQLKQIEKDADEAQKHYDNLEAEMKHCGCEPPSDTVLEIENSSLKTDELSYHAFR
jgi:hypothetical protein